ncbi:MAG TPA: asparagine synthase-related protein [Solirubrobacteraceae bacterium]
MAAGRPAVRLSGLEIATHLVFGRARHTRLPEARAESPREALEAVVREALVRPPCVVSFSGGRDSSVVLAVAAHVARREGLPLPVPATIRAPAVAGSVEDDWQERVVAHLRLPEWQREVVDDQLDFVGPVARDVLARHGLLFPAQVHFHVPLLRHASGGTLLTGAGGDDVLEAGPRAVLAFAWRRFRAGHQRTAVTPLIAAAPRRAQVAYVRRRRRLRAPWLTDRAHRELDDSIAEQIRPPGAAAGMRWTYEQRWLELVKDSLGLLATDAGAAIAHPVADGRFVAALAGAAGWAGPGGRSRLLPRLAGDLLPRDVLQRRDKTAFAGVYWNRHTRELLETWQGEGVDTDVVDVEALRETWASRHVNMATALLLQSVWLARRGG